MHLTNNTVFSGALLQSTFENVHACYSTTDANYLKNCSSFRLVYAKMRCASSSWKFFEAVNANQMAAESTATNSCNYIHKPFLLFKTRHLIDL